MNDSPIIEYKYIKCGEITLHVAIAGPESGEPIILLHGFPDAHFGWKHQISALATKGFRVIAPDQRGYNLSDKPKGKRNYMMDLLIADIINLSDAFHLKRFNLAGHDFGAIVSWILAANYPDRVKRLAILNVPHPKVMSKFIKTNKKQRKRSWYAFFFQIPLLPEILLRANNWKMLAASMRNSFGEADLEKYRESWSQPGSLTAMLNWYRCFFKLKPTEKLREKITVSTLILWGKRDPHLMWEMAEESAKMCTNGRLEYLEDATHWLLEDEPEITSQFLIEHFTQ